MIYPITRTLMNAVAAKFGLLPLELSNGSRKGRRPDARQLAVYMIRELTELKNGEPASHSLIGQLFGRGAPWSSKATLTAKNKINFDQEFRFTYVDLKDQLWNLIIEEHGTTFNS